MSDLPQIEDYSQEELSAASTWPAIARYLGLLNQKSETTSDRLRLKRHAAWLRASIATFHDKASAKEICEHWSDSADRLIDEAWRESGCEARGYGLLALGKLGAGELNLSSDVDLIIVRPDTIAADLKPFRDFQALLSEVTAFGFCLRTDFTIRPGGSASSAIPTLSEFIHHYGYHGEMWERLAFVRLRILSSSPPLAEDLRAFTRKFSFRKHLDYTVLDDLKSLRAKIRSEKFVARPGVFDLKLGIGGIRELELFVHALQVLHGGRYPKLQTNSTTSALHEISSTGLLPPDECEFLSDAYWRLRTLENRMQGYEDQQTYALHFDKCHDALPPSLVKALPSITARVSEIVTSLLGHVEAQSPIPTDGAGQRSWLIDLGFSTAAADETWPALLSATALSKRSESDERARLEFLGGFVTKLAELGLDRDLGLSLLLDFVRSVRAKASFFTLLNREPRVRDELATLFSVSPYLGTILVSRPELIDEFIYRKQAEPSADLNALLDELAERRLLAELISANSFLSDLDLDRLTTNLTANADAISLLLLDRIKAECGAEDLGLIALGKWGGQELGLRSDLDFIFITRESRATTEAQKAARRFLSRITEPHRGGSIYSVDMRLRPSGNAGPIMVSEDGLEEYLLNKAAAWERQAYLRSRALHPFTTTPAKAAASRGLSAEDRRELSGIRAKLFVPPSPGALDLKLTFGGLADIEFTAQIALLARGEFSLDPSTAGMIQYLEKLDPRWAAAGPTIREKYASLRKTEQIYQLTTSQSGSKLRFHSNSDESRRLALILDLPLNELEERLRTELKSASVALDQVRDLGG